MTAISLERTNWLVSLLIPLQNDVKLGIINSLSASMMKTRRRKAADMSFFDGLTGAWNDEVSAEEE